MLDKDTFINYMNEIIAQCDTIKEFYKCINKIFGTNNGKISEIISASLPIKILADIMNDKNGLIKSYIYNCSCGYRINGMVVDNKEVTLKTIEDLWNVLTA
jgi:hypothetical protein